MSVVSPRRILGALLAVAVAVGIAAASQIPYAADAGDHAVLRLAWRARAERVEECRRLTPDELAQVPVHMRQDEVCEGRAIPYRLELAVDGAPAPARLIHAAGARGDRPLYVFHEIPVDPGTHRVTVAFSPAEPAGGGGAGAEPLRLTLDSAFVFAARRIVLVTYDAEAQQLIVKTTSPLEP